MPKSKGQIKKEHILSVCRELFYEHGYVATSARMISKKAQTNLGLLNYYFEGKGEIGRTVYITVRDDFNSLIEEHEPGLSEIDKFLFSSALELYICLKNPNFGLFFIEIIADQVVHERLLNFITKKMEKFNVSQDSIHNELSAVSLSAIKPALVRHALYSDSQPVDDYILYYLEQQMYYLGIDATNIDTYIQKLKKYHIDISTNFKPIFVKIRD